MTTQLNRNAAPSGHRAGGSYDHLPAMTSEGGKYRYVFVRFTDTHDGRCESGVQRYGRKLYESIMRDGNAEQISIMVGDGQPVETKLADFTPTAGIRLIVQVSPHFHFRESVEIARRIAGSVTCDVPHIAVLHDANNLAKPLAHWRGADVLRKPKAIARSLLRSALEPRLLSTLVDAGFVLCVFDEYQVRHLPRRVARSARVVPHFVEPASDAPSTDSAKAALGLDGRCVLTILGYINPRKGNETAMAALQRLPPSYVLIIAGGAIPGSSYEQELDETIERTGLADRARITGYLSDSQHSLYIAATDLALCLFNKMSASGSLSTWISHGKRILASNLPEMRVYNRIAPGALSVWQGKQPSALAEEIVRLCERAPESEQEALRRLRDELSIGRIWRRLSA